MNCPHCGKETGDATKLTFCPHCLESLDEEENPLDLTEDSLLDLPGLELITPEVKTEAPAPQPSVTTSVSSPMEIDPSSFFDLELDLPAQQEEPVAPRPSENIPADQGADLSNAESLLDLELASPVPEPTIPAQDTKTETPLNAQALEPDESSSPFDLDLARSEPAPLEPLSMELSSEDTTLAKNETISPFPQETTLSQESAPRDDESPAPSSEQTIMDDASGFDLDLALPELEPVPVSVPPVTTAHPVEDSTIQKKPSLQESSATQDENKTSQSEIRNPKSAFTGEGVSSEADEIEPLGPEFLFDLDQAEDQPSTSTHQPTEISEDNNTVSSMPAQGDAGQETQDAASRELPADPGSTSSSRSSIFPTVALIVGTILVVGGVLLHLLGH